MGRQQPARSRRPRSTIDVTEGTWLSLDVSPDGKEIVFDLLGDLYTIPIAGGEAKALIHDVAWQMQPRYSPDGKTIAFTSDQGGGDNIWIMDRDGTNPRAGQQGELPPAQPAGLDAGRPVHRGPQALHRPALPRRRRDVALPPERRRRPAAHQEAPTTRRTRASRSSPPTAATSTSARTSPRAASSSTTRTRTPRSSSSSGSTGRRATIQRFVTGAGGSVRPTPSPDGKTLAFIRRVRGKSVIHLLDLRSGEIWPIYDGLDRDMQETWSIHGLYPGDGLDAGQQVARLLGRRQDPAHRRRQPQGRGHPLPRPHHAARSVQAVRFPSRGGAEELRRPRCCAG